VTRSARLIAAGVCLVAALIVHDLVCEWRTVSYAPEEAPAYEERVLVSFGVEHHASGNASWWDARQQEVRAYHQDWMACYRDVRGMPRRDGRIDACVRAEAPTYESDNATVQAVLISRCELAVHGEIAERQRMSACMWERDLSYDPPRWTSEIHGNRFTGPYTTRTALLVEDRAMGRGRALGALLGVGLPLLLTGSAAFLMLRGREAT
jgi:hypothetical protein